MLVTDKKYNLEKEYVHKLDLMIKRINGVDDVVLPIDGDEGTGKTELAVGTCYYIAYMTGRKYTINNIFFDLNEVIKFAQNTNEQIIHFDEAVLGLLIGHHWEKAQQQFIQLVMVARKKKHFVVLCIPKFHRLPPYLIEERALGLVHVYSRRNLEKGRFCYFKKESKDRLYDCWKRKKIKAYKDFYDLKGTFGEASKKVFTKDEWDEYERKKDEGILSIGKKKEKKEDKWLEQRNRLIACIRLHNKLTAEKTKELFNSYGIEMSRTTIKEITQEYENKFVKPSV